jgi:hypothetical protein
MRPTSVSRAIALLWTAYALAVVHEVLTLRFLWTDWIPERVIPIHVASFAFFAGLIYLIYRGHNWARWVYTALAILRAVNVAIYLRQDLESSARLVFITAVAFACQAPALYWLFTSPGSKWFVRHSAPDA